MSLFPTPVINDGTADRTFAYRAQLSSPGNKAIVGEWVEPAATLSAASKIVIKHDESKASLRRRLFQYGRKTAILDGTLKSIVVNVTVQHHPEHTEADIAKCLLLAANSIKLSGFIARFLGGFI